MFHELKSSIPYVAQEQLIVHSTNKVAVTSAVVHIHAEKRRHVFKMLPIREHTFGINQKLNEATQAIFFPTMLIQTNLKPVPREDT